MKSTLFSLLLLTAFSFPAFAGGDGGLNEPFVKTIYVKSGGATTNSGTSYDAAKSCAADGDLWDIPAGTLVKDVQVVIDTGLAGSTGLDIGDDDNADGFVDSSLSIADLSVAGMYHTSAKLAGDYLRVQTAGATDAGDIDVVPAMKYYAAAGKELKLDITTACSAGRFRVMVTGFRVGTK
jgi:hypothetical protein